jgi:outer membrane lipoprotein-sorting protein
MFKHITIATLLSLAASAAGADDVKAILKQADDYRLSAQSAVAVTRVELYKDDKLDGERLYHVYLKSGRRSLVLFKTPAELGQKMLMLDDKFWLFLPSSKRPLRITATQKLLGEASAGDIATMTLSEDYDGNVVGSESVQGVEALKLDVHATREGASYARIVLWVRADNRQPLQAELYLVSGKLAKLARYEMGRLGGRPAVVTMHLSDRIQLNRRTVIHYQSIEEREVPDKLYNPAYLLRENLGSL